MIVLLIYCYLMMIKYKRLATFPITCVPFTLYEIEILSYASFTVQ